MLVARSMIVALALGALLGCGPSLRRVQQSQVYFERCYAADFDPRIALAEKRACWRSWRAHYTHGQPEERVRYAEQRLYGIEHGEAVPRLPGLPQAALGPRRAAPVMAVSSGSDEVEAPAREPVANAQDEELRPERRRRRRPRRAPLPRTCNQACASQACEPAWRACVERCERGVDACETACEVELQACARGCF